MSIIKGVDLFIIDQSPQMYLSSEKGGFKVSIIKRDRRIMNLHVVVFHRPKYMYCGSNWNIYYIYIYTDCLNCG